ncbi:hypothetical protein ACIBCT_28420 [Streptosporangium sp. NPDC050855]|uniref:hypothetical protein n=1 Tax=Streptosporangium sp. NPDC050855 TaxID=3366194 RepID=UPI0037894C0A
MMAVKGFFISFRPTRNTGTNRTLPVIQREEAQIIHGMHRQPDTHLRGISRTPRMELDSDRNITPEGRTPSLPPVNVRETHAALDDTDESFIPAPRPIGT